jgi:tetratricopeptide (TPR) repeat protein
VSGYYRRGLAYRVKRDLAAALADFTAAIELYPEQAGYFLSRADTYRETGDSAKAIADYRKALELKPDLARAREGLRALGATP